VNGKQFIRQTRGWARAHGVDFEVERKRGKGGHQIVRVGEHWTTVKSGEIKTGLLSAMLAQLGIPKGEF
jgi:hypothetical protein